MFYNQISALLKKNLKWIFTITTLSIIGAFAFFYFSKEKFKVVFALTVSQEGIDLTKDYQYDNYYSQEALDLFTDSLEKWFRNPAIIIASYNEAGVNDVQNIQSPNRLVKGRKLAPAYLEISFKANSYEQGKKITQGIDKIIQKELQKEKGEKKVWFKINTHNPYIESSRPKPTIIFLIGLTLGIFFNLLIIGFKEINF